MIKVKLVSSANTRQSVCEKKLGDLNFFQWDGKGIKLKD